MDEKGCQRGGGPKYRACSRKLELVTIIECVCVNGTYLLPRFIFAGKEFELEWFKVYDKIGLKAFKLLLDIHKSGIRHNLIDLDTNITCLDGRPFVTNFSEARAHDCPDKEFEIPTRLFDLDAYTFKCGEIRDFYRSLRSLVAPARFHWYGYDVDYNQINSLENIFQHERRTVFAKRTPVEEQWKHAVQVWQFLCANWSSYHEEGEAPSLGNTSFEAYKAKYGLNITCDDD
ncbi:hypothetical protein J132_00857 [Termitomyces sp. J132]|nr:hypothetical protein J132_00857 [Termitomyces sp. J132]